MNPQGFLNRYKPIAVYHFTDYSNVPSITRHGLLSHSELKARGIGLSKTGGSELSKFLDSRKMLNDYVHLCFVEDHPMAYIAQKEERISCLTYIKIKPEVLLLPDVMGCDCVANKDSAKIVPICDLLDVIDFDSIYADRPQYKSLGYQQARRAEILVPHNIESAYILKF